MNQWPAFLDGLSTDLGAEAFAQIAGAEGPRTGELALKLNF